MEGGGVIYNFECGETKDKINSYTGIYTMKPVYTEP
jgi:hypothetical protein